MRLLLSTTRSFALLLPFMATFACTHSDAPQLSPEDQKKLNEYKAEVELGRNMAGRLLQFYGTYEDANLDRYLNTVGQYVASYSDFPDRKYMFVIIDSDAINAFACPGGYIMITKGTVRLAKTEAELAMILGHEVAHVGKQHMFKTLTSMSKKDMDKQAEEVDQKGLAHTPESVTVRTRPEVKENDEAGKLLARYLSGGGLGISILKAAKAGMNVILEKGLDQKLEYEADREGVRYAIRAGYSPSALMDFLDRLNKGKKSQNTKILAKTHPTIENRTSRIRVLLKELNAGEIVGADGRTRFAKYASDLKKKK